MGPNVSVSVRVFLVMAASRLARGLRDMARFEQPIDLRGDPTEVPRLFHQGYF
jgi:hypothetical protein